jgi:hypothetical protein
MLDLDDTPSELHEKKKKKVVMVFGVAVPVDEADWITTTAATSGDTPKNKEDKNKEKHATSDDEEGETTEDEEEEEEDEDQKWQRWDVKYQRLERWIQRTGHRPTRTKGLTLFDWMCYWRRRPNWRRLSSASAAKLRALGLGPFTRRGTTSKDRG